MQIELANRDKTAEYQYEIDRILKVIGNIIEPETPGLFSGSLVTDESEFRDFGVDSGHLYYICLDLGIVVSRNTRLWAAAKLMRERG